MAEEEPLLTNPPTHDAAVHVHDYERFTRLAKYAAITALIVGLVVLLIIS